MKSGKGDGVLPSVPDRIAVLGPEQFEASAQEARRFLPRQPCLDGEHGDELAHPRADELVCLAVEDQPVDRLRVAVEDRRHHPVGRLGDGVAEEIVELIAGTGEQSRQRPVGARLAPRAEQMEDDEEVVGAGTGRCAAIEVVVDRAEEHGQHGFAIRVHRPNGSECGRTDAREFAKNRSDIHGTPRRTTTESPILRV